MTGTRQYFTEKQRHVTLLNILPFYDVSLNHWADRCMQRNEEKPDLPHTMKLKMQRSVQANMLKRKRQTNINEVRFRENVTGKRSFLHHPI